MARLADYPARLPAFDKPARGPTTILLPGFKRNALGVSAFLWGGAALSPVARWLQFAITAALADLWTQIVATVILGLIIVGIGWIVLRAAAVARRWIQLTLDGPIGALWETIRRCGEPPKDPSRTFALIAIGPGAAAVAADSHRHCRELARQATQF